MAELRCDIWYGNIHDMSAVSRPPQHLPWQTRRQAVNLLDLMAAQKAPVLRSIDRNLRAIRYGDLDRMHEDIAKACRALTEQTYNCP